MTVDARLHATETRLVASLLIGGAVLTVVSRALVAYAGLPSVLNFVHYPMILGASVILLAPSNGRAFRALIRAVGLFLVAGVVSWAWNGDQSIIAALLNWVIFSEVFLVAACVIELEHRGWPTRYAERTALGLVLCQVPLGLFQFVTIGLGDPVQGMLIGQGAGAHVFGFMALATALWLLGSIIQGRSQQIGRDLALLVTGFLIAVITDAKQGIAVFIVVCPMVVLTSKSSRRAGGVLRKVGLLGALAVLLFAAFQLNTSSTEIGNVERRDTFVSGKVTAVVDYTREMRAESGGVLLGLGPGKTASRVAWLAPSDSTLTGLGITPSDLTVRLYWIWNNDPRSDTSTGAAPFFSWLGVLGDLGLIGLAAYVWCWVLCWRLAGRGASGRTARSIIVFSLALGVLFNWLEEPALMAVIGLLLGVAISQQRALLRKRPASPLPPSSNLRDPASSAAAARTDQA